VDIVLVNVVLLMNQSCGQGVRRTCTGDDQGPSHAVLILPMHRRSIQKAARDRVGSQTSQLNGSIFRLSFLTIRF
jgi:hypothetical protein